MEKRPKRKSFKFEKYSNGLLFNFHNTISNKGKLIRIRLIAACFNHSCTQIVTIDHRGNIFVIDCVTKKIWKIFDQVKKATLVEHNIHSSHEYIIGTKKGEIVAVNSENGLIVKSRKYSCFPIDNISIQSETQIYVSHNLPNIFLVSTNSEALLINIDTFEPIYNLELDFRKSFAELCKKQILLKFVSFIPNSNKILACFTNDSVHIWSTQIPTGKKNTERDVRKTEDDGAGGDFGHFMNEKNSISDTDKEKRHDQEQKNSTFNLKTIRILYPLKTRDKIMKTNANNECSELKFSDQIEYDCSSYVKATESSLYFVNSNSIDHNIMDFRKGLIKSIDFSLDGSYICLTSLDGFIMFVSTINFEMKKIITTKPFSIKKCLSFGNGVHNIIGSILRSKNNNFSTGIDLLAIAVTTQSDVLLIDCNDMLVKSLIAPGGCAYKMHLSSNGKLFFVILNTGEIKIFQTSVAINSILTSQINMNVIQNKDYKIKESQKCVIITEELKNSLSRRRLNPILNEFGSYSTKYRHLIWTSLLDLPSNKSQFSELLKKGTHPVADKYDQEFPIKDAQLLRNLKKIASCLMNWSKVLSECDFLPKFIFPFLKIYPNSSILTFEMLVTILYNHCQLWFEFAPMEPLNYLGLIENLLHYFDSNLHKFYQERNITNKIYAWPLLTTCFSEVLDEKQWYQLWDNILTRDIDFLIYIVLAYQIIQRNIIMKLETEEAIKLFYHEQYIIDIQKLVRKAVNLKEICPNELNPGRYLKSFMSLPEGYYPKFEKYPKEWIELKDRELHTIRLQNSILDQKIRSLEIEEIQLAKKLEEGLKEEETQKRLKELEKIYCIAISREEERTACQRKMVLLYQKDIRNRHRKILDIVQDSTNRKNLNLYQNRLDTLMRNIERTRTRDETDMILADEDLKDRELNLLSQCYKTKSKKVGGEQNIESAQNLKYPGEKGHLGNYVDDNFVSVSGNLNINSAVNHNAIDNKKNESRSYLSRTKVTRIAGSDGCEDAHGKLAKEFTKRSNVFRKTHGVQLNTKIIPTMKEDKDESKNNTKQKIKKTKRRNYTESIEGILNQIQKEFKILVDPE